MAYAAEAAIKAEALANTDARHPALCPAVLWKWQYQYDQR